MKNNKSITTVVILFLGAMVSFSFGLQEANLIGMWNVDFVQVENTKDPGDKFLTFKADGKLEGGNIGKEVSKNGTWSYDQTTRQISLTDDANDRVDVFTVVSVTIKKAVLTNGTMEVHLSKVDQ